MSIGFWQIAIVVILVVLLFGRGKISIDILPLPNNRTTNITTIAICQKPMLMFIDIYFFLILLK